MTSSAAEIENIVRLVIQRLQALDAAPMTATSATEHALGGPSDRPESLVRGESQVPICDPTTLFLTAPLVTLEHLRGRRLDGVRVVEVTRRAVVTPAVKDELRLRGIQLRKARPVYPPRPVSEIMLIAPATKTLSNPRVVTEYVESSPTTDAELASDHLVVPERRVVWCSRTPFAAHHALCSRAGVRVALLYSLGDLLRADTEMQPNVLLLDDRRWSLADLNTLVNQWQVAV